MSTTNWSSQAGMGDGDTGEVTSGSTTIDTNWTQSSGMTDVSGAEEANIVELVERAETAATNAETAETNAETAETNAETAQTAAETAKTGAETAKTAAETAQTAAQAAQTAAETAETNAETAYANTLAIYGDTTDVQNAVNSASTSATNAATSATAASTSATSASTSASAAATSATAAATSATSSASSASTSNTSALAAQTAEANAETAEANAITARLAAESAEANAETSATQAANSATSASSSASQALSSKNAAASSESAAATSAYNAGVSESNAATSETNAATSATNAASSATSAASSASSASSSATDAETAQTAAESAQASAEAVYDSFDDRYLGSKSSDPTLDNDGDALLTGALYFNTTENEMRVYTGTAWDPVQELSGDQIVNSLTSNNDVVVKGNLEVQGTTITVDSATAQTIDLGDNDKIRLGDADDLQIYHDGTDSYIANTTGTLKLSGNTDVTGNISVSGTVDGRDIATDGSKLDGIEAGADVTDTANVTAAGALMDSEVTNLAQVKAFDSADYATAAQGTTADNALPKAGGTMTGDLAFGDNVKAKFGAGNDLQIYHDDVSNSSYIADEGSGRLRLRSNPGVTIQQAANTEKMAEFEGDGAVNLYYDNSKKFETTSSGVDITGAVVADGLTVDGGNGYLRLGNGDTSLINDQEIGKIEFYSSDSSTNSSGVTFEIINRVDGSNWFANSNPHELIIRQTGSPTEDVGTGTSKDRLLIGKDGDISFYEDTGTTAKLTWDASAEELQFKDNVKAEFGDGGDLSIYHDGSQSRIVDSGTGNLNVQGNNLVLSSTAGNPYLQGIYGGTTAIYYNGSSKLATTSTGIDVTGTVTADGLTVSNTGSASILNLERTDGSSFSAAAGVYSIIGTDDSTNFYLKTNGTFRQLIKNDGDISFYDSAGTSQDFYWDASASRLGIGTTSPSTFLHVNESGSLPTLNTADIAVFSRSAYAGMQIVGGNTYSSFLGFSNQNERNVGNISVDHSSRQMRLQVGGSNRLIIKDGGDIAFNDSTAASEDFYWDASTSRLGLGTTSPGTSLSIQASGANGLELQADTANTTNSARAFFQTSTTGNAIYSNAGELVFTRSATTRSSTGTESMRIDSSGRLGIGRTPTSHLLETAGEIKLTALDAGEGIDAYNTAFGQWGLKSVSATVDGLKFEVSNTEHMRIDSSGNLLVGTTSSPLSIVTSSAGEGLAYQSKDYLAIARNGGPGLILNRIGTDGDLISFRKDGNGTAVGSIGNSGTLTYLDGTGGLIFKEGGIEAVRIDTSGNILVGKTSSGSTGIGVELVPAGAIYAVRSGNLSAVFDRKSSDGQIVQFRKDGSTVGSIGVNSSNILQVSSASAGGLFFADNGTNKAGFANGEDAFRPAGDGFIDLGKSDRRFDNLYLSGGVYLGGTGSANLLDDYEEGTWTPVLTMTTSGDMTATANGAKYTKVGRMVHFTCYISGIDGTSPTPSGNFRLTGLPFTSLGSNTYTPINISYNSILSLSNDKPYSGYVQSGNTYVVFTEGNTTLVDDGDVGSGGQIMVSGVYQTA